jgi:hypothetical protein
MCCCCWCRRDYDAIIHDEAGYAAYVDPPVVPTYQARLEQPLCDNQFAPYPDGFQLAYRTGGVLEYVKAGEPL